MRRHSGAAQENAARADIRFDGFQYNADMAGAPISKNQAAPKKPGNKLTELLPRPVQVRHPADADE